MTLETFLLEKKTIGYTDARGWTESDFAPDGAQSRVAGFLQRYHAYSVPAQTPFHPGKYPRTSPFSKNGVQMHLAPKTGFVTKISSTSLHELAVAAGPFPSPRQKLYRT